MFYILDKTGRIIGSATGAVDANDLATRGEVAMASELDLPIDQVDVIGDSAKPTMVAKVIFAPPKIVLSTSAKDADGDGIAELPADGESQAMITATLQDSSDELIEDQVEILFRTSAGALSSRYAVTNKGKASVELTASRETVMATVSALAAGFEPVSIEFEFLPVQARKTAKK